LLLWFCPNWNVGHRGLNFVYKLATSINLEEFNVGAT
jgi:hypothetical protein